MENEFAKEYFFVDRRSRIDCIQGRAEESHWALGYHRSIFWDFGSRALQEATGDVERMVEKEKIGNWEMELRRKEKFGRKERELKKQEKNKKNKGLLMRKEQSY